MKLQKSAIAFLSVMALVACGPTVQPDDPNGYEGDVKTIVVDGGGDISNFNSTASMKQSTANPYPYNTLETLCKEWSNAHPGYTVKVNKTSSGGDRSVLLPQLQTHTAPHIIYQNGTVLSTDLGQDYYVNLTPYLESPSPYLDGGAAWKTVYNQKELATTQGSDGNYYYVNLEKIPVAFVYNKTLLNAAGVEHPENITTFSQFIDALSKLDTLIKGNANYKDCGKYATEYTWYQIAMECNLFPDMVTAGDVLRVNGIVDTEEICRLYTKGIYNPLDGITSKTDISQNNYENNRLYEYISQIARLDKYKENATFAARQNWISGKLGFMEVTGSLLRTLNAIEVPYEWGTICFPDLTTDDSKHATTGVVRGTAGLASSWWISNRALDDGTADMCADLLMFLTAPKQNNRLIGDLKGGIPLNPDSSVQLASYLQPLVEKYNSDIAENKRVSWASFNTWGNLGTSFNTTFIRNLQEVDAHLIDPNTGMSIEEATAVIAYSIKNTVAAYTIEYDYDTSNW